VKLRRGCEHAEEGDPLSRDKVPDNGDPRWTPRPCISGDIRSSVCFVPPLLWLRKTKVKTTDLIDHVASEAGVEKSAAKKAVEAVLAGIVDAAKKGEEVNLPGFGKFKVKDSPARQGRNPATGETIDIAASRKLGFSPAKQVKDALAG
jgi:DNA-binding protein HU-beta